MTLWYSASTQSPLAGIAHNGSSSPSVPQTIAQPASSSGLQPTPTKQASFTTVLSQPDRRVSLSSVFNVRASVFEMPASMLGMSQSMLRSFTKEYELPD